MIFGKKRQQNSEWTLEIFFKCDIVIMLTRHTFNSQGFF